MPFVGENAKPKKPLLVRKKSGEIVRPVLKPTLARTNSAPTKFVHFDSQLEYVKLFLKSERPESISNPPSDDDCSDSDDYSELSSDNEEEMQLTIRLPNFPPSIFSAYNKPVTVEKVGLSEDKSCLIGNVMVQNLAFHKNVIIRYTFDFWQSVEEMSLDFKEVVINSSESFPGVDKFQFSINLKDKVSVKLGAPKKNMFFAVRYQVDGQEHWDNNEGVNYQVEFVTSKPRAPRCSFSISTASSREDAMNFKPAPLKSAFSGKLGSRYSFGVSLGSMFTPQPLTEKVEKPKSTSAYFYTTKKSNGFTHPANSWDNHNTEFDFSSFSARSQSSYPASTIYGSPEYYSYSGYSSPYSVSPPAACIRG
ncbi:hypothetical protein K493DRAFT_319202 [Basidiobolus meristosporus CBS 931.73]|uniref:CBM21 domain-containing protein n=1 Tax=Basidiobolus meristosporus CBS 931.73 TaxID=1314790 RepID=A0A1Y1XSR8_9FUNG|nr:hypothetical protein K493DRAFT_319202 [Basidiobolus meristosporus CBS 931.73]|eukprot:ORX88773.1 hypothetical protein K493DRAFT_319202 [Basidiobolus meristosporus CBS 931.73]